MRATTAGSFCLASLLIAGAANAETVALVATRDATIYADAETSNGAGQYLWAGTGLDDRRRNVLMAFDIVGNVPADAVIENVTLRLHLSGNPAPGSPPLSFILDECCLAWGESINDPDGDEIEGLPALPGDATWRYPAFGETEIWNGGGCFPQYTSIPMLVADEPGMYFFSPAGIRWNT